MSTLHVTYRPQTWDEIFGQGAAVNALRSAIENDSSHAFILSGPSGCGKTTLARIAATELGCDQAGIMEIDAATYTGIEQMRQVQELAQFQPLGESPTRAIILDEAHRLSPNAWDSLLKATEEPPDHVYWFFCTTRPEKMPKTMITRCLHLKLTELTNDSISDLVVGIADIEKIDMPPEVRQLVVSRADGSPRQALVNLAACRDVRDRAEAAELLQDLVDADEALQLFRLLASSQGTWEEAMRLLDAMNGANPDSIRIQALRYFASCARKARTEKDVVFFLQLMNFFSTSYEGPESEGQLLRSIGRCLFSIEA